jgi:hypothetical protein
MHSGEFKTEDTRRDRKACVEAMRGVVVGRPSNGATKKIPKVPLGGLYLSFRP